MNLRTTFLVSAFFGFLAACDGASSDPGVSHPIIVHGAQLRDGPLPGSRTSSEAGVDEGPSIVVIEFGDATIRYGQTARSFGGRASGDVVAIGVGFAGYDDSHWVFPVGNPDAVLVGSYKFDAKIDFGTNIPSGPQRLEVVAIDAEGNAGRIFSVSICVLPDVPDNGATCDPNAALPDTIVSLVWSTDVDLDLIAVTPEGKVVSLKHPNTSSVLDGGFGLTPAQLADPSNGRLTRDSNRDCVIDSVRRESIVFDGPPPPGTYRFYARLTRACSQLSTQYIFETYRNDAGALVRADRVSGDYLSMQASGTAGLGTLISEITFP